MSKRTCPTCSGELSETRYRPFCSKRCADVDLQRWFTGRYVVPAVEQERDSELSGEDDRDR
jgi:hypothetical protein